MDGRQEVGRTTKKRNRMKINNIVFGKTQVVHKAPYIAFVTVQQDDHCGDESPLDYSGARIISLGRKHSNFDPKGFNELKSNPDNVILGYFEHGISLWYVSGETPAGANCPWDNVPVAGLWVAPDYFADDFSNLSAAERREKALESARHDCEVYTAWCNGEVYYYSLNVYKARHSEDGQLYDEEEDYRHDEPVLESSLSGYYVTDDQDENYLLEQINSNFKELDELA